MPDSQDDLPEDACLFIEVIEGSNKAQKTKALIKEAASSWRLDEIIEL